MKDAYGNIINVGDKVAYVHGKNSDAKIRIGAITRIYPSKQYGIEEECSVDGNSHILPYRVLKL